MRSRLNESGSFLLRTGDRVVVGFGVAEEWIAYTPDQAMDMLNDMRLADGWKVGYFSYDLGVYMQGMSSKFKDEFK
ncbi:MAG: hypothetical protein Q8P27_02695, partial [Candidatus Peregrinibacteria bacterium]|nr:hypothetical protein [Candidatus Peregrinibacteria bacterium]